MPMVRVQSKMFVSMKMAIIHNEQQQRPLLVYQEGKDDTVVGKQKRKTDGLNDEQETVDINKYTEIRTQ